MKKLNDSDNFDEEEDDGKYVPSEQELLEQPFTMPMGVLNQITECSPDGFILFTVNDVGDIELFHHFSADIIEAGLKSKALQMLKNLKKIDNNEMVKHILQSRGMNADGEPNMDEDEEE